MPKMENPSRNLVVQMRKQDLKILKACQDLTRILLEIPWASTMVMRKEQVFQQMI